MRASRSAGFLVLSALDAEAPALRDDLRNVLSPLASDLTGKCLVFLDNRSVGNAVGYNQIGSSQSLLLEAEALLQE